MKIFQNLSDITPEDSPIALTIGFFDGIHLGHQEIFKSLYKLSGKKGSKYILTFENHPAAFFNPDLPVPLITSLKHKLHLFEEYGIDGVILLPFNHEFANQTSEAFLKTLHAKLPFSHLILGENAAFGKNNDGNQTTLPILGQSLGFEVEFLPKETHHKEIISSGLVRKFIEEGKLKKVKKLLGRPYSIYTPFLSTEIEKDSETLYKWSIECPNLCLLPSGVYGVDLDIPSASYPAIAFLNGAKAISGHTNLSLSLIFEHLIPHTPSLNISFVEYLHDAIDPNTFQSSSTSLLESMSAQPSPS